MDRNALRPLIGALVGVVAVAVAAATLTSTFTVGTGTADGGFGGGQPRPMPPPENVDASLFKLVLGGLLAASIVATAAYVVYLLLSDKDLGSLLPSLGAVLLLLGGAALLFFVLDLFTGGGQLGGQNASGGFGGDDQGFGFGSDQQRGVVNLPAASQLLVVLGLVGAAAFVLYRATGDVTLSAPEEGTTRRASVPAEVGRVAGRAADRIEANADVDNEVYRAWKEMTGSLDVEHPRSSTPAEFADAAVAAGIEREHVEELTRLFEEVRYGGKPAETREEQAVAALRHVESEYAGEAE